MLLAPPQLYTLPSQPPPSPPPTPPRANSTAFSSSSRPATGKHMPLHDGAAPSDRTTPPPRLLARRLCTTDACSSTALTSRHCAARPTHCTNAHDLLCAHRANAARSHKLTAAAPPAHTPNARAVRRAASRPRVRPVDSISTALAAPAHRSAKSAARCRDIEYHFWHSIAFEERNAVASNRAAPTMVPCST